MSESGKAGKAVDSFQQRLTEYACALSYADLPGDVVRAAKARIVDAVGALVGGFFGEPCRITRHLAAQMPHATGATVLGTRWKTTPDMAAFINATTARYVEMTDSYHAPGSYNGHGSDTIMPVFAAAEHAHASGRDLITNVVLGYEIYLRICDVFHDQTRFDNTNFACLASAVAAGKLFGLGREQMAHCISMAVVPNVILREVRSGHLSMFKGAAAGQGGRSGVFAALLARAGMEGPHLPFQGKAGWFAHVAGEPLVLKQLGGNGTSFKILEAQVKLRPCAGSVIAAILAAEKIAPLNGRDVKKITVELYGDAMTISGKGEHHWKPATREAADHSAPYVVAAALRDGTVTLRSFDDAHLRNPEMQALMQKIEVVENPEFTKAFERLPVEHRTRITAELTNGERRIGESGGGKDDMAAPRSDAEIEQKFRMLSEDALGAKQATRVLDRLWNLEDIDDSAVLPSALVLL